MELVHLFTCVVAGPSGSEKSVWVSRFLENSRALCTVQFDRVLVYYAEWQEAYAREFQLPRGPEVKFREGLSDPVDYSHNPEEKKLLILDDLMREGCTEVVANLVSRGLDHKNSSVLYLTQNIFHQGKCSRDISLNAKYIVLFKSPQDRNQIRHLAQQVYPEDTRFVREAFPNATAKPHIYLFFDLTQSTSDKLRFRAFYAYVPKISKVSSIELETGFLVYPLDSGQNIVSLHRAMAAKS